jgi:hypothetical protein
MTGHDHGLGVCVNCGDDDATMTLALCLDCALGLPGGYDGPDQGPDRQAEDNYRNHSSSITGIVEEP